MSNVSLADIPMKARILLGKQTKKWRPIAVGACASFRHAPPAMMTLANVPILRDGGHGLSRAKAPDIFMNPSIVVR